MHHDSSATPLPDLVSSSSASASSTRQPQASLPGHDPATVLASARGCSSEEEALHLFQATLLDWVDDYSARPDAPWLPELKEAIVTLWIEYAQFQRSPKLAVEAFEAAVHCPVASHSLRLWTAYAQWLHSKNKPKAAQDLYLRALIGDRDRAAAELSPEERDALWVDFHALIVTLRGPIALSLQDFKAAVLYEHATTHSHVQRTVDANDPPAVVSALHSLAPLRLPDASTVTQVSNQLVHDIQTVSPDITAEWLARDGAEWPSRPEPPLFQTSPPKWLDASGKDVLGTDMALQLIRLLLKTHDQDYVGNALLEIAKACWMMNALKEKEASLALEDLDRKLMSNRNQLDLEHEARLSVAGSANAATVDQWNQQERLGFMDNCNRQRIQLLNYIAWDFRHLLAIQQQILTKAGVPGFDGPTADANVIAVQANICGFLHSAFFLRARVGETSHMSMLRKQEERLLLVKGF